MEYLPFVGLAMLICVACYHAGQYSNAAPDEEEMILRLKEIRYQRKLKAEACAEVTDLIQR